MSERQFECASYKTHPKFAKSATGGGPMPERSPEERREGRDRVSMKLAAENVAMQFQRDRIEERQKPTFPLSAANDNAAAFHVQVAA